MLLHNAAVSEGSYPDDGVPFLNPFVLELNILCTTGTDASVTWQLHGEIDSLSVIPCSFGYLH
jgi:hypothetical protein